MNTVLFKKYFMKVSAELYVPESVDQNSKSELLQEAVLPIFLGEKFTSMPNVVKTWSHMLIRMVLFSARGYKELKYYFYNTPLLFIRHKYLF